MFEFLSDLYTGEAAGIAGSDRVILLKERSVAISSNIDGEAVFPRWEEVSNCLPADTFFTMVGKRGNERFFAAEVDILPEYCEPLTIRQFLFEYPEDWQMALCRAKNILNWRRQHRFCGGCKSLLEPSKKDSGLLCPACGNIYYPQISPAVIVAVTRNEGRELLLAHNRTFSGNVYSLIAGFVEAGESVEGAIHRELWEECSIRVKNLNYISSQMWPFPNSLMLAFHAEYDSGSAEADGEELSDLGWFTSADHPELPAPGSIARKVIDRFFN